jgi:hypothetical protein
MHPKLWAPQVLRHDQVAGKRWRKSLRLVLGLEVVMRPVRIVR